MGRSVLVHDGKAHELSYRKKHRITPTIVSYQFWAGDMYLGMVQYWPRNGWTAVSSKDMHKMTPRTAKTMRAYGWEVPEELIKEYDPLKMIDGFGTREAAGEYLIRHHGLRKEMD